MPTARNRRKRNASHALLTPAALASQTVRFVDAERCTATRASPLRLLTLNEIPQSPGRNPPQIFDHAHAVLRAIALVQMTESLARVLYASRAISSPPRRAIPDFARDPRLGALISSATGTPIPAAQKPMAQTTIHSARRDQCRRRQTSNCGFLRHCSVSTLSTATTPISRPNERPDTMRSPSPGPSAP